MLSVVIVARDEADRIGDAIRSVAFADEVLVLDSGSTDGTVAIAEGLGARVLRTDWPGFVAQKNRGLAEARGDWVLSLDADERVSPALAAELPVALAGSSAGWTVPRLNLWLGHPLRHGHWYPDRRLRLVRRDRARWVGADPHDRLEVDGPVGVLRGDVVHLPYRSLGDHLARIDRYTKIDARDGGWADVLVRPAWHFWSGYVFRAGFLDGLPGLYVALLGALYVALKWGRRRVEAA